MSLKEFVKVAVGLREHPKVLEAGDDGGWLFVCAIMWSKEHDTDGFIPEYAVPRLTGLKQPKKIIARCTASGLFEEVDGGWMIHDYLEVQESSERRKAAGKKAAKARWDKEKGVRSASESQADRTAIALRGRNTEEEEEEEEEEENHPPGPPQAGGAPSFPVRPEGNRKTTVAAWDTQCTAFSAEHFPGVAPGLVAHLASQLRSRRVEPTAEALRPLIEQHTGAANAA